MGDLAGRGVRGVVGVARNNLLAILTQALLLLLLAGFVLLPVFGLGLPVLVEARGLVRQCAAAQRRWAGRVLGVELDDPDTDPGGRSLPRRFADQARDRAAWRDVGWLCWQSLAGPVAGGVVLVLVLIAARIVVKPNSGIGYVAALVPALVVLGVAVLVCIGLRRVHAIASRWLLAVPAQRTDAAERITELARSRTESVDTHAAELRRIERDLHDGVQARLVALGMSIGMTRSALRTRAEGVDGLLADAQTAVGDTLDELRALVRGIHPPVLAERGLAGAVESVAMSAAVPVHVEVDVPARFEPAVESALYFAAAEALTNIGRHSGATHARLTLAHHDDRLVLAVTDDGTGGADPERGSGLRGIRERLTAFDGTMSLTSPRGGPTEIRMELPCAPSSPKTSPSSATG